MEKELFTVSQAAIKLGVTPTTVRNWDRDENISVIRTAGGHRRIKLEEINRLLGNVEYIPKDIPEVGTYSAVK